MPSEPLSDQITDDIVSSLQGINGSTSYHFDVHNRVDKINTPSPNVTMFPSIQIISSNETPVDQVAYDTENLYTADMVFEAWGWVQNNSYQQRDAHRIAMDIRTAIEADTTLGGTCMDVSWQGTNYFLASDMRGVAIAVVKFRARYFVSRQATSGGI